MSPLVPVGKGESMNKWASVNFATPTKSCVPLMVEFFQFFCPPFPWEEAYCQGVFQV